MYFAKFLKAIMITERLSRDSLIIHARITLSALYPQTSFTVPYPGILNGPSLC